MEVLFPVRMTFQVTLPNGDSCEKKILKVWGKGMNILHFCLFSVYTDIFQIIHPGNSLYYSAVPFGSLDLGMDCLLSKSSYKGTILQRHYRKMTILWSYSYNSFVKHHGEKQYGSHNMTPLYQNMCYKEVCYKGITCIRK